MTLHRIALVAGLSLLSACTTDFDGPEEVKDLRVLAVKAVLPELGAPADANGDPAWPTDRTGIATLVAHPGFAVDGAERAVVLHLACTPVPGDLDGTSCTRMSELSQPADLLASIVPPEECGQPGAGALGAITFSGMEACTRDGCRPLSFLRDPADPGSTLALTPGYALPPDFSLGTLPAGHPQRLLGTDVVLLSLILEATTAEVAPAAAASDCEALQGTADRFGQLWPQRPHVAALKWIHARGPEMPAASPPNVNPSLSGMTLGGRALEPAGGAPDTAASPGRQEDVLPVLPGDFTALRQVYQRFNTEAQLVDTKVEEWGFSWFAAAGELEHAYTNEPTEPNHYKPVAGRTVLWLVVRDIRGGVDWASGLVEAR